MRAHPEHTEGAAGQGRQLQDLEQGRRRHQPHDGAEDVVVHHFGREPGERPGVEIEEDYEPDPEHRDSEQGELERTRIAVDHVSSSRPTVMTTSHRAGASAFGTDLHAHTSSPPASHSSASRVVHRHPVALMSGTKSPTSRRANRTATPNGHVRIGDRLGGGVVLWSAMRVPSRGIGHLRRTWSIVTDPTTTPISFAGETGLLLAWACLRDRAQRHSLWR